MGQRSQIYVRFMGSDGTPKLIARYFPWNYGERMVSRARWTMEWAKEYKKFLAGQATVVRKLIAVINTNFDLHDVALTSDLVAERNEQFPEYELNAYVFGAQNCNDGKLFIDLSGDQIKYAFCDRDGSEASIMDAEAYMAWDYHAPDWRSVSELSEVDTKAFNSNATWIKENAVLMTPGELVEFKTYPYSCEPILPNSTLPHQHIEALTAAAVTGDYTKSQREEILSLLEVVQTLFLRRTSTMPSLIEGMTKKITGLAEENKDLERQLQNVSFQIQSMNLRQPEKCLFGNGVCGYPIDDCYNCPNHRWNTLDSSKLTNHAVFTVYMNPAIRYTINSVIHYGKAVQRANNVSPENHRDPIAAMQEFYKNLSLPLCMRKNKEDFDRILDIGWHNSEELKRLNSLEDSELRCVVWSHIEEEEEQ